MKRLMFFAVCVFLLATFAFAVETEAEATQHQLRTLAQYPKNVRVAILELLNHPAVLKKIEKEGPALEKAIKGEKAPVQEAARLLAKSPEVLKLLKDHPDALALAAKAYADNKTKVATQLDEEETATTKATEDLAARLLADQEAVQQLKSAIDDYAKVSGSNSMDSGVAFAPGTVTVMSQPSPPFINHVMRNADRYPALSNTYVSQWLSARNAASYDRAFYHWWAPYQNSFHHSLLHPDEFRHHRLGELARFDRNHASVDPARRYNNFHQHAKDHPHLAKLPSHDPKRHVPLAGMHHKPDHRDPHPAGKGHRRGPAAGFSHHHVHHRHGGHAHHMHHAHAGHHHHAHHHGGHKK